MNKIISTLTLSVFLGISGLSANGIDSVKTESTFTQADSVFLFGENAKNLNVQVLSQEELKETKGEFWTAIGVAFGISAVSYGLCAIFSKGCRIDFNYGQRF
ncbi:hypothetical protein [Helicobacter sp. T3_23-1059]